METTDETEMVTLAMENEVRRAAVIALLDDLGLRHSLVNIGLSITDEDRAVLVQSNVVILDTDDDAASLVHIVHEIYKLYPGKGQGEGTLPLIGMLSTLQYERNPRFGYWIIDGSAAITVLLTFDHPGFPVSLRNMLNRLTGAGSPRREADTN